MNIEIITDADGVEHVIIDRGNNEFTSMPKAIYDQQEQAKLNGQYW